MLFWYLNCWFNLDRPRMVDISQHLANSGALPVLERLIQFTSRRHTVLANNIANLSTPYFKPRDVDPQSFLKVLGRAVDRRRRSPNPQSGPLEVGDTRQLKFRGEGMALRPEPTHEGVLFHDQNNRDLERTMQDLAENTMTFNVAIEFMRQQASVLDSAIRERL